MPAEVSTCGANTTSGLNSRMAATASATGTGAKGASAPSPIRRAFRTRVSLAILPISRICVQRKLNQPLRMIRQRLSVANCRATASIPNVPLPGTMTVERAW